MNCDASGVYGKAQMHYYMKVKELSNNEEVIFICRKCGDKRTVYK